MAYYADIDVYAALPGTYSLFKPDFHISSDTLKNVDFFTNHLNIETDSKNYGLFDKVTVEKFNKETP